MTDDQHTQTQLFLSKLLPALRGPNCYRPHLMYSAYVFAVGEEDLGQWIAQTVHDWNGFPTQNLDRKAQTWEEAFATATPRQALTAEVVDTRVTEEGYIGVCVRYVDSAEELAAPPVVPASEAA